MFTGIVTDVGRVRSVERRGDTRLVIETRFDTDHLEVGASVACSGVCLTVVDKGAGWFAVDASAETLGATALGHWDAGQAVNLERALKVGDELGGHIVTGHVDGVGEVVGRAPEGDSVRLTALAPKTLAPYIARKGSITWDGVSLTVNEVEDTGDGCRFGVNIVPHTQAETTLGGTRVGDPINLEIDILARYVARLKDLNA
ncbi:riboflavin synthase alpha chain [Rhodothalassium salexigens DSM 2132]|uniref:Riboflavin synthase n=1 Tax=Rhodothalassium salexigens DSM 2132 TaxID=1188247 RepID=A0A4R2PVB5_RHOSA|nr:riboflavin synthase [Rhodothalassium salexigens]MBB4209986.1 riboflavin synthase [Rhodothalassium salexigens DSM 2132]MBK1637642.1 riboflavin synthase [Rhodothalassium salexigens DSM 2132]TCP38151.1 riboflavin synthase alpha chain [Rhodothalassium salexigens DSM 2132]